MISLYILTISYIAEAMVKLGESDFIPVTLVGQLKISLLAMSGTLFISIGFLVLINLLALSAHEKLALSIM